MHRAEYIAGLKREHASAVQLNLSEARREAIKAELDRFSESPSSPAIETAAARKPGPISGRRA